MKQLTPTLGPHGGDATVGDCKVLRWPEEVPSFEAGRECHLDGLVKGLNEALPHMVYRPPPDFFGAVQLEIMIYRAEIADPRRPSRGLKGLFCNKFDNSKRSVCCNFKGCLTSFDCHNTGVDGSMSATRLVLL